MSGGVDSSAAALLVKKAGFECIGCTMELYDKEAAELDEKGMRPANDADDARSVASRLGMPFYVFDFKDEFRTKVIDNFVSSYLEGRTPNPCIECNRCLKFGRLFQKADELGCDIIVTGHYARIEKKDGRYLLKKGLDAEKDQSYVLYTMTQEQLSRTVFPLGEMTKQDARDLAERHGFANASKSDSQDICFVPDGDYAAVVERYSGKLCPPGDFADSEGNLLGRHKGIIHYTVGQRKGLGISCEYPLYVLRIDAETNKIVLGPKEALPKTNIELVCVNWISGEAPKGSLRCRVKNRYKQKESAATVTQLDSDRVSVEFDEPKEGAAPGQSAVFYDGDTVLGGGIIV